MGRECQQFINVLAEKIADKRNVNVSEVTNWLRTKICFALIRSLVLALRGHRGRKSELVADTGEIRITNNRSFIN